MELSERREELAGVLPCEWCGASSGEPCREWDEAIGDLHEGTDVTPGRLALADLALASPAMARLLAEVRAEALRVVRVVEGDMADRAAAAWRSADARRGLSDHEALIVHADALTRWSERFRMAMNGEDYRDDRTNAHPTDDHAGEAK